MNNVLVFKVDRLTRNTKNLLELVELFEENNCSFNSLTESIDTSTASGRMFLKIIGIFAEFERENIVERVKVGMERKVKEGYTLATGKISYGYEKAKGQKVQTIEVNESKIVKEIFSMFVDKSISMNEIARILNRRKIPTRMKVSWEATTIKAMLSNPTYIGRVRYSLSDKSKYFELDGHHEPIISEELFYLAQEKFRNNSYTIKTKRPREESYFCGVLTCSMCRSKYTTHNYLCKSDNGENEYKTSYRCLKRKSCNPDISCKCPAINHGKVEKAFCEYIQNISDITEYKDINIEENTKKAEQEMLKNIVEFEKKLDSVHNRKKQVMEQYVQGNIDFDEYKKMKNMFNGNFEDLEEELQRQKDELSNITQAPKVLNEDIIFDLKQNWDKLSNNERMIFLQRFVKRINITVEKANRSNSTVKIDNIEFQTGELPKREHVRQKLR